MQLPALAIQPYNAMETLSRAAAIKDAEVRNRLLQRKMDMEQQAIKLVEIVHGDRK